MSYYKRVCVYQDAGTLRLQFHGKISVCNSKIIWREIFVILLDEDFSSYELIVLMQNPSQLNQRFEENTPPLLCPNIALP